MPIEVAIRRPRPHEYDSVRDFIQIVATETFKDLFAPNPVPLGEPLVLAHVIRHLGDVYLEQDYPELAEPCYHEARDLYLSKGDSSSLNFANAIRSLAMLRWEQSKTLWKETQALYTNLNVESGIDESKARIAALSMS